MSINLHTVHAFVRIKHLETLEEYRETGVDIKNIVEMIINTAIQFDIKLNIQQKIS